MIVDSASKVHPLTVRIHSKIVDGGTLRDTKQGAYGHSAVTLWYLLRGLDSKGQGWVKLSLQGLSEQLNKSIPTVKRYLRQGLKIGLFHGVNKHENQVQVFYASQFKVALAFELENWGTVTEVELSDLESIHQLKLIATQAETQRLQESSRRNAIQVHRKGVAEPNELVNPSSQCSRGARGELIHRGDRTLFVSEDFIPFGVSQQGVAKSLKRCDRTIRKRLSNSHRLERGLFALQRVQLAQTTDSLNNQFGWMLSELERSEIAQSDQIWKTEFSDRVFSCCGLVFKSMCNVYSKDLVLNSMRRARSLFNRIRNSFKESIASSRSVVAVTSSKDSLRGSQVKELKDLRS